MTEVRKKNRLSKKKIVVLCIIAAVVIIALVTVLPMLAQFSNMRPVDTQEVIPGIYAVKDGYVNVYLVEADEGYIVVDAGSGASGVEKGLDELGISANEIKAVLLTHTHGDHTGAMSLFGDRPVYGGAATNSPLITETFSDGETKEIAGREISCIFTPGHYVDSVVYIIDGVYMFAGDTLSLSDGKAGLFNSAFNNSDAVQAEDIKKLSQVSGIKYILSAHHGYTDSPVWP
jgi:glyoxylase-like metal-dependent hydrolase (beta-lactamase superfamily II)